jgi:hypothetical protein
MRIPQHGDLAKAEQEARAVEEELIDRIVVGSARGVDTRMVLGELKVKDSRRLATALKLIRRHEKIGLRELWARRHARMAI